jgi:hypothetical protein
LDFNAVFINRFLSGDHQITIKSSWGPPCYAGEWGPKSDITETEYFNVQTGKT